jgi:GT2 family glycosyltransferase
VESEGRNSAYTRFSHSEYCLSIVIPSYRRADLLKLCLESIARFAPPHAEVIVVDDGSHDAIVSRTAAGFLGVRVVRRERAGGFCIAANAGIMTATAPVVQLLNDDAEVTRGWAEAALRWFADPRVSAVAPLVLCNDPERTARGLAPLIDTAGDEYDMGGFARKRGSGKEWIVGGTDDVLRHAGSVFGASGAAAFYRREALLKVGGFPEHFKAYFEDVDLSFRLRRLGGEVVYDPASVVLHRVSSSYGKRPPRRVLEQQSCNEERVFWRNVRGWDRLRWMPRHVAVLAAKAVKRLQEGTLVPWLMGRVRALRG